MMRPVHSLGLAFQMDGLDALMSLAVVADAGSMHGVVHPFRLSRGWLSADHLLTLKTSCIPVPLMVLKHRGCLTCRQRGWPVLQ